MNIPANVLSQAQMMKQRLKVKELIENKFPRISGEIVIYPIGGTISVHTGPGTVALFFMGDERV